MAKRMCRDARPGEVRAWLSARVEKIKTFGVPDELRVWTRTPCCSKESSNNPSLQVNERTGMWRCFRCAKVGNWFTLTKEWGAPLDPSDRYVDGPAFEVPREDIQRWVSRDKRGERRPVHDGHYPELLKYAESRLIGPETLEAWRVSSLGPNSMRWPIYGVFEGSWAIVNSRVRKCLNHTQGPKDWFEISGGATNLLIGNHLLDTTKSPRCVVTEGQWDAMTAYQMGFDNVFSLPNGATHIDVAGMLRYIPETWEVWLAMDMDSAGDRAVEKFFLQLGTDRVARLHLPEKDLNDWVRADPTVNMKRVEETARGLTTMVSMTGSSPKASFVSISMSDDEEEEKEAEIVGALPWPRLNALLGGGLRSGQTTGLLAPSGVGKTTWCNQVATYNSGRGFKTGVISLEGTRQAFTKKIKAPIRGQWRPEEWDRVLGSLLVSPLEGKKTTTTDCLVEFNRMIDGGANLLVLDNLDYITTDNGTSKAQAYGEFISLAMERNVHIVVVWQPNKISRETVVNSGDQKGYSQTFQDADNYINLNVIEDFVRIEVEKAREEGVERLDNKTWLVYDRETRCFEQVESVQLGHKAEGSIMQFNQTSHV